jgi:hypothetical protein
MYRKSHRKPPVARVGRVRVFAPQTVPPPGASETERGRGSPPAPSLESRLSALENIIAVHVLPAMPVSGSILTVSPFTPVPKATSSWLPLNGDAARHRWYPAADAQELVVRAEAMGMAHVLMRKLEGHVCVRAAADTSTGMTTQLIKCTRVPSVIYTSGSASVDGESNK